MTWGTGLEMAHHFCLHIIGKKTKKKKHSRVMHLDASGLGNRKTQIHGEH